MPSIFGMVMSCMEILQAGHMVQKGFRLRRLLHMKSGQNMPEKYMENNGKRCIRQR